MTDPADVDTGKFQEPDRHPVVGFDDLRNLESLQRSLEHTLAALNAQTDYSAVLSWAYRELLTAVSRVDQKYGPYDEFAKWREQGYAS